MAIKVAIVGLGNCASSLLQSIEYYKQTGDTDGLTFEEMGGHKITDIEAVIAFDIDKRKVDKSINEAIYEKPNCTYQIVDKINQSGKVQKSPVLDGMADTMSDPNISDDRKFIPYTGDEPSKEEVITQLKESGAEILVSYLPVGSVEASRFWAECALKAGLGMVNCIPVFLFSDPNSEWPKKFEEKGLPIIGDDIKSQMGATIIHRVLTRALNDRGVKINNTYQINFGGNTDFLNLMDGERIKSKKVSKTMSVISQMDTPPGNENVHVSPSAYIHSQNDQKIFHIRFNATILGGAPVSLDVKGSVEDSPNSSGSAINAIMAMKVALDNNIAGRLDEISAVTMKHPRYQLIDTEAISLLKLFIEKKEKQDVLPHELSAHKDHEKEMIEKELKGQTL